MVNRKLDFDTKVLIAVAVICAIGCIFISWGAGAAVLG